jgi:ribosomal protein S27E
MTQPAAEQSDIQCQSCGGQCAFDPAQQDLLCQSCGSLWPLATENDHEAAAEFPFNPDAPMEELPGLQGDQIHQCETCGGEVIFTGPALSENCPYCNGPVVLSVEDKAYATMALVPFRIADDVAQSHIESWIKQRIAAPNDLGSLSAQGRLASLYAPFWTFDTKEAVEYWASYDVGSGKSRRRRKRTGRMNIDFNDLLVPASTHVTPLIRDGILHDFKPHHLRPYRAGYLAGFAAERHHMSVRDGLEANKGDKDLLIRNLIKSTIKKPNPRVDRYRTDTTGIHYRRILLPVWILHYTYDGHAKKVVVSGIDGRTYGERPFSKWKLAGYSAVLTAITIAFGWIWGATGIL